MRGGPQTVTALNQLSECYGRRWLISPGVGAGWYAIRRGPFSTHMHDLGLSEVRCGATLADLAAGLEIETRLEDQSRQCAPLRLVS